MNHPSKQMHPTVSVMRHGRTFLRTRFIAKRSVPSFSRYLSRRYVFLDEQRFSHRFVQSEDFGSQISTSVEKTYPEQLRSEDKTEDSYQIVNLYHLVDIQNPDEIVGQHREWMKGKDIHGRIYFSKQGVNAQFTGKVDETNVYLEWMRSQSPFEELRWNCDPVEAHMFPKLRLKHKPNLVQLNGGISALPITRPEERATPLNASEWKTLLKEAASPGTTDSLKPVVLDVRNGYEWDAGHFVGASRPKEDAFSETPVENEVPEALQSVQKQTPILMYCTGGIRCDIYSTVLKKHGFENLYTLEGGVQKYFKEKGDELWEGSLFVFDGRMAIRPETTDGSKELPASIQCEICGGSGKVPHVNCANVDCNRLFIACVCCKIRFKGCCCEDCMEAPRLLRPPLENGGHYGKFGTYAMNRYKKSMIAATERKLQSRQRRNERKRRRRFQIKEARLQRKRELRAEEARSEGTASLREVLSEMKALSF